MLIPSLINAESHCAAPRRSAILLVTRHLARFEANSDRVFRLAAIAPDDLLVVLRIRGFVVHLVALVLEPPGGLEGMISRL